MKITRINKIFLFMFFIGIAFLINKVDVHAKQVFPNYTTWPSDYDYCDYEIYTEGKDLYNQKHIYFVYVDGKIKWINPNTGDAVDSGARWDTDRYVKQQIKYEETDLSDLLVEDGKLKDHCDTIYFYQSGQDLVITTDETNFKNQGGSEGIHYSKTREIIDDTYSLKECYVTGYACTQGDACSSTQTPTSKEANITLMFNNDNSVTAKADNGYSVTVDNVDSSFTNKIVDDIGSMCPDPINALCSPLNKTCVVSSTILTCSADDDDCVNKKEDKNKDKNKKDYEFDPTEITCKGILGEDLLELLNEIFLYIKIAVPIILIVLGSVDFGKAVLIEDKEDLSKATSKFIKRCIIAVAIFFIPSILNFLLNAFNEWSKNNITTCDVGNIIIRFIK